MAQDAARESGDRLISTGSLPDAEHVQRRVDEAHAQFKSLREGDVADHIPELAEVDPDLFGICVRSTEGGNYTVGDAQHEFSIQSISKAFVFALACASHDDNEVRERIGVNNTGLSFSSVMALELNEGSPMNPMVNAGALVSTSMVPGSSEDERWSFIQQGLSRFAGRDLHLDEKLYASEAKHNQRNQAIARLLESYGKIDCDPLQVTDIYTRQCSLMITAEDLAVMGATLADGGENPLTGEQVVSESVCRDTLAVMASNGFYEKSGDWLFEVGVPGKSGVSGGIVTVAPGKGSVATFSPPLDSAGNSVRGHKVANYLSKSLGMNVFASEPHSLQNRA
ncbi:glutaminase A [Humidisolicoccus flavus]|uniref:glutaminase A n=1 Tax=Humidisolicoccus flavus TaxID=3111414 RepID=UPI003248428C